jgi:hypothetical protein
LVVEIETGRWQSQCACQEITPGCLSIQCHSAVPPVPPYGTPPAHSAPNY